MKIFEFEILGYHNQPLENVRKLSGDDKKHLMVMLPGMATPSRILHFILPDGV
jgi:hypothetical protein